jgi:hypothetical protein
MTPTDAARGDPFFGVLRRRHPDVDLVMLPPLSAEPPAGAAAFPARARAVEQHAVRALEALWDRLGVRPVGVSAHWWAQARTGTHRHVVRATVTGLSADDTTPLLRDLGDALLALGWDARPAGGARPRIVARVAGLVLTAVAEDTSVPVEVVSSPLVLTAETLAALERSR